MKHKKIDNVEKSFKNWMDKKGIDWLSHPVANTTELAKEFMLSDNGLALPPSELSLDFVQEVFEAVKPLRDKYLGIVPQIKGNEQKK